MKTIPNTAAVEQVTFHAQFSALCSVGHRPFWGDVRFRYQPSAQILEFVSVEEKLNTLANQSVTIEDVARFAFNEARCALGHVPLEVVVFANTTVHGPAEAIIGAVPPLGGMK